MRRYTIFSVVALALLLASISNSSATVAFPVMVEELKASLIVVGWVLTAYQLVQTVVMAVAGKISDIIGARRAFVIYILLFSAGSILSALSPNVYVLIGARAIQAIGGGGFMPCAAGIVSDTFPESRQRYIGLFTSIFPIGSIIGPNLGGWMVEAFGWRSIFWVNVPLGLVILVLASLLLPSSGKRGSAASIDITGAGLLFASLSAFMFSVTEIGNNPSDIPWGVVGVLLALSVGLLVAFLRRESRAKEPIVDLELLRERPFLAANIYNTVYGICALGTFSLIPLYAVTVYNMSILQSGVLLTPRSIAMMVASAVTSFSLLKWGYRKPILAGTLTVIVALGLIAVRPGGIQVMGLRIGDIPLFFVLVGICGIGHGICTPASNNACIELMPDKVATITGLRGMFRSLGSTLGITLATLVLDVMGQNQRAFYVVFFAPILLMLISLPTIFMMPSSPNVSPLKKQSAVTQADSRG
jgi:EmrB/QacA subfamily drug resistance transporter